MRMTPCRVPTQEIVVEGVEDNRVVS
jgi:hypothetical protein